MASICRFCDFYAAPNGVCSSKECKKHLSQTCKKVKKCGHACGGVTGERVKDCPPCFQCSDTESPGDCAICLESLTKYAMLTLSCGHKFHYSCVGEQLGQYNMFKEVSFNHAKCSICRTWIEHPKFVKNKYMQETKEFYKRVKAVAKTYATENGVETSDEYMRQLSFYKCIMCKEPYCGGERACEEAEDPANKGLPKTCVSCTRRYQSMTGSLEETEKCAFCPRIATFFCWGNTYICGSCHKGIEQRYRGF